MRLFTFVAVLFCGLVASAQTADFRMTVNPRSGTASRIIDFIITAPGTVSVNWGDGTVDTYSNQIDQQISHQYPSSAGNSPTITITGQIDGIKVSSSRTTILQWGNSQWKTMFETMRGCQRCAIQATDIPDLRQVTDMSYMFTGFDNFTDNSFTTRVAMTPLNWDTSNVTNMEFLAAGNFNEDISMWDVSSVTNMSGMFIGADDFNQTINSWDVSNVTDMSSMFEGSEAFNQPLDNWDVSNVTDMSSMFEGSEAFNQPLDNWDVSSVTTMQYMFKDNMVFNSSIDAWDMTNAPDLSYIFENSIFNQPLNNWNVSNYTDLSYVFRNSPSFNQSLNNWDVSNVTTMRGMFQSATSFNQSVDNWNVSNVTDLRSMFHSASSFNKSLNSWVIYNSPNFNLYLDCENMFYNATSYNQPLNWGVNNSFKIGGMFYGASSFNQDLSSWNFRENSSLGSFIRDSGLDTENYDRLLQRFVNLRINNSSWSTLQFNGTNLEYCDAYTRNILISRRWRFTGDTQSSICPDNNVSGTILYDINNNGCDASDAPASNIAVEINDGTNSFNIFTINGQYSVNLPPGTYTITPLPNPSIFVLSPASTTITVGNSSTSIENFCFTSSTTSNDLEITILPLEDARPGFDTDYKLIYKNKGTTRLSGTMDLTYQDDFMGFLTASPATTSSNVGMLSWDFSNLDPFETREIEFSMNLNTPTDPTFPLNSNDLLDFSATINPTANDDTPLDNVFDLQQTVVNSYDPNDKTCLQGETILPTMVGEFVHYRIRFENEGTASAVNVRIVDYIDTTKFDVATLTPLSGSHDYTTTITDGNKVEFNFENIMLPFTAPASQGYVLFKIKTVDTLVSGDDFSNQAEIYFDFNFPIITNLETTGVAVPLSLNDNNLLQVSLYPNPAKNKISLMSNIEFNEYTIYDTLGAIVSQEKLDAAIMNKDITLDHLVSGLYFVEVKGDQMNSVLKLIKK
ncbi:BspA family leucine-rich repeat surface protein [Nonlabens sp. Asnod2-A12]|uniref:BspA family leucine-rich repeat surface protein n=1 Tax=Nonlabens sp. Asnod2-A12 TaxID=3160578 RepID=UPI003868C9AA